MIRALAAAALALAVAAPAHAADDSIDPDRPDVSAGAKTVGAGRVQIESGILLQRERRAPTGDDRDRRDDRRFSIETLFRIGITETLELRVEAEPYVRLRGRDEADDHGDFTLAAKWRFFEPPQSSAAPALALIPSVKLPVAEEPIGSGKTDFGLLLAASFELPWRLALDLNAGAAAVGQSRGGYLGQALLRASASREVLDDVNAFGEVFFNSRAEREASDQLGVDAGIVWKLTKSFAVDAAAGTFVHGQGADWFVRAGASVRFGR